MKGVAAILVAAGSGRRMHSAVPKQFLPLDGVPVILRTLRALLASPLIEAVLPVVPASRLAEARRLLLGRRGQGRCLEPVAGGTRRQDSVRRGLERLPPCEVVLVHDGVRPFVSPDLVARCVREARAGGAALCAVQPPETVKLSADGSRVDRTVDRRLVWLAQTPQAFRREILEAAFAGSASGREYTDEAAMVEESGHPVSLVPGSPDNIKITTPRDLVLGRAILRGRRATA